MKICTAAQQHKRMTETPVPKLLTALSIPTVASQLVTVVYNTADTWFVSRISTGASAAVGVTFALQAIIQALGYGFSMGVSSLISRRLGEKKNRDASRYASSAFYCAILSGLIISVLGLAFLDPLMLLLGSTSSILPYSRAYAFYILLAAPVMCGAFVLNGVLRSEGSPAFAMIGLCSGGILNIALDPLLIFTFDLGIAGAAIATAASQTVSFILLLLPFLRRKSIVSVAPKYADRTLLSCGEILTCGAPTVFRQGLSSLATALLNRNAAVYGDAAVAAMTIVNKIYNLVRSMIIGIGQGFQPIAGFNYGAGLRRRTKQSFLYSCAAGTCVCVVCAIVIALFPENIITWFRNDPEVIEIGKKAILWSCRVMPFMAYSTFVNQLYQCLGFKVQATLLASCRQGIAYVPLVFILPVLFGLEGVELLQPAADMITFLISVPFQIFFFQKYLAEDPR